MIGAILGLVLLAQTTAPINGHQPVSGLVGAKITDGAGYVNVTGTSLDVNCTAGCSGSSGGGAASLSTNYQWSGTAWVRVVGDETNGTKVQVVGTVPVSGPLTDAQLRAVAVPVSGTVTATGPLTDAQLRAVAVPVSGTVTVTDGAGAMNVIVDSGTTAITGSVTVTDGAGALNVIVDSTALPTGAATSALQLADNHNVTTTSADQITPLGTAADGAAVSGNPLRIAGKDGGGLTQDIITDAAGELQVDVLTLPALPTGANVIGALTANQSVNLAQVAGAVPSVTNPIPTRLGNGTSFISTDTFGANVYLRTSMAQDIEVSTSNSSVVNLASAASFTGTSQSTLGVGAVQVCIFADQNLTISVQQAQEDPGTNWNIVDSWTYTASSTGHDAARTIQAVGTSVRVVITNNGASTTTAFRAQTLLMPVGDTLPRGLSQQGNLRVSVNEWGQKRTYTASTAALTATAAGTGPFFTICGSATQTIKVQRFNVGGSVATAAVRQAVKLQKTSAATSGGTATALVKVPLDSTYAAATANLVNFYTVLATPGTLVGTIGIQTRNWPITATVASTDQLPELLWDWAGGEGETTLRGTAQCLEASFGATTTNAPTLGLSVTWTEE